MGTAALVCERPASIEPMLNKLICGDCLSVMRTMPDACVERVVTSPPYNLLNTTGW